MPNSLSKKNQVIKITIQDEDIILQMKSHNSPYIDTNITLDMFEAKSLAYTILAKVCHIEKDLLLCDCGREKNCLCPVCEDDS